MKTAIETCENCGKQIGKLETPRVHKDQIVCRKCWDEINEANPGTLPYATPVMDGRDVVTEESTLLTVHPAMFRASPVLFLFALLLAPVGVGIIILLIWWLQTKCTTLIVTTVRSTLREGILSKGITEVYHRDVRNVQITQNLDQRLFRTGNIGISSAAQAGMEIEMKGIPNPYAVRKAIDDCRRAG